MLHGKDDLKQLEKGLKEGDLTAVHPECITDTWIGRDRFSTILKFEPAYEIVIDD